jgi:predicted nucleotide-binding protein (sugar kinase/HSP70/actin superfamily)
MSDQSPKTSLIVNWMPGFAEKLLEALPELASRASLLPQKGNQTVLRGLSCANNDACFSSIYAVGQVMDAVLGGECPTKNVEVLVPSTCVNCRAGDLPGLLRRALSDAGFSHIPVQSLAERLAQFDEDKQPVLSETAGKKATETLLLCDLREQLLLRLRPRVKSDDLSEFEKWSLSQISFAIKTDGGFIPAAQSLLDVTLSHIPDTEVQKPYIAFVGTAPSLFNATINSAAVLQVEEEGCEVCVPWYSDFVLYGLAVKDRAPYLQRALEEGRAQLAQLINNQTADRLPLLLPPQALDHYQQLALASKMVSKHETSGAGWLYVGQVLDMLKRGARHIVYAHSFGCLPAHTIGRGIFRELRARHSDLSIVSIEYDPGASAVNQSNRLKLLTSQAKEAFCPTNRTGE